MSGNAKKKQKLTPGGEAEKNVKQVTGVLKHMMKHHLSGAFLYPVDWKTLKLPMYPKLVKNPMDLGTIEKKLQNEKYASVEDFKNDVMLVWHNAMIFNQEGSEIYEIAATLKDEFEQKMQGVRLGGALREGGGGKGGAGASSGALSPEELAQMKGVVKELRKHKDAAAFLQPVDWKALGIPDYLTIIKRPMDLGTVMKRLEAGQYSSVHEVAGDVELIWNNAMTYNVEDSWIYTIASELKKFADLKMAPILASARGATEAPHELTFEMKHRLNVNASLLSSKDLYGMVGIVEESCKRAIDQSNPEEVEIDIDSLDLQTFLKVDKWVQDCIKREKKKSK